MIEMHISLNATLLVQAFNFGIAYILFRTLLLKPAIAARNQEQEKEDAAVQSISAQAKQIEQIQYQQKQLWRSCNTYFATHKPEISKPELLRDLVNNLPPIEVSLHEEQKAAQRATQLIQQIISERL